MTPEPMTNSDKRKWLSQLAHDQAMVLRDIKDAAENRMRQRQAIEHAARERGPDDDDADDATSVKSMV